MKNKNFTNPDLEIKNKNFTNPDLEIKNKNFMNQMRGRLKIENFHIPSSEYGINKENFRDPNVRKNKMKDLCILGGYLI